MHHSCYCVLFESENDLQPLRTRDWDRALVEYTAAMLVDTESGTKTPLAKRLREIKCPGNNLFFHDIGPTDKCYY